MAKKTSKSKENKIESYESFHILFEESSLSKIDIRYGQRKKYKDYNIYFNEDGVFIGEKKLKKGRNLLNKTTLTLLEDKDIYETFIMIPKSIFTCSKDKNASLVWDKELELYYYEDILYAKNIDDFLYLNNKLIEDDGSYGFSDGDVVYTRNYLIEKKDKQFKISSFFNKAHISSQILIEDEFKKYPPDFPKYMRSPRIKPLIHEDKLIVASPKSPIVPAKNSLIRAILPALGMFALTGISSFFLRGNPIMMLGMGGFSLLTAATTMSQYFEERKDAKKNEKERVKDYRKYLLKQISKISYYYQEEKEILSYKQTSMDEIEKIIENYDSRIYERMDYNDDFLRISLGLGKVYTSLNIICNIDDQNKDKLAIFARKSLDKFKYQKSAPINIDLNNTCLGIVANLDTALSQVSNILLQVATFHSYLDVNFINLVSSEDYDNHWSKWRFLPHFKMMDRNVRGFVHDDRSRELVLNSFYKILQERSRLKNKKSNQAMTFKPHYIFTIMDDSYLSGHSINEYLSKDLSDLSVSVIWVKESQRLLPDTVTSLVEYKNKDTGVLLNENLIYKALRFKPYKKLDSYEKLTRILSNLNHVEIEKNTIPSMISFLSLYKVNDVEDLELDKRWEKADTSKSLSVAIGVRGKDDIVNLNLHEKAHGPHGLIAGTTGSGKSELIQSYILSLSINFSPEDIGFLTIDFKGGSMANLFSKLPHMLGSITNLDKASSIRALESIKAELRKRQKLFSKYGVNHINAYTKLYKKGKLLGDKDNYPTKALPHLFLISDEFAELKENEPEFMTELISIARIGRSIGVHLILATQKPSGVVNDQIWSNSRFKIALKVADSRDSNEIIKTPDAASIKEAGRAYLQVGNNEIYELFQSAYSGSIYDKDEKNESKASDDLIWIINDLGQYELISDDLSFMEDSREDKESLTELEAIVDYIHSYCQSLDLSYPDRPWLKPLKSEILSPINDIEWDNYRKLDVPFAYMDIPKEQSQKQFNFNIEKMGHTVFYGSPGFGKSTALQTLILNLSYLNSPDRIQFCLFDFSTNGLLPLKDLNHVIDLTRLDEEEKLEKFIKRIEKELRIRKKKFIENKVSTLNQYERKTGEKLPLIVTIFDGFDNIKDTRFEEEIENLINMILRQGASLGLYILISVLRFNSLKMSMSSNITSKIVFYMVDRGAEKDLLGREALISQEIAGRCQYKDESPLEMQVYLPSQGENDIERLNNLENEIKYINSNWHGDLPDPIPMLKKEIKIEDFINDKQVNKAIDDGKVPIGYCKEDTKVVSFNPKKHGYFIILYENMKQADLIERAIIEDFRKLKTKAKTIVIDINNRLEDYECFDSVFYKDDFTSVINDIESEIKARENIDGYDPIYIYLPDIQIISENMMLSYNQLDNILRRAHRVKIYFIFQGNQKLIENKFDEFSKRLRNDMPAGIFGTRFMDQSFIKGKVNYKESLLNSDEVNYFEGRDVYLTKLADKS